MSESIKVMEFGGRRLTLTSVDKVLWPDDGFTKLDVIQYYSEEIAEYLLPALADRPLATVRMADGIAAESVYQKQAPPGLPAWMPVRRIRTDAASAGYMQALVGLDNPTLVYLVNLGCVSFHPWSSTFSAVDRACELRFDLDAVELPFRDVRGAALLLRELLAAHGLRSWVKTSGGNGLHVLVPLEGKDPFDRVIAFGSAVAREALARESHLFTLDMRRNRRRGRILVDVHRNSRGATLVSPYSLRERPGAPVSMPLAWPEVERNIYPEDFHIRNAAERLRATGDLLADFRLSPQKLPLVGDSRRQHQNGEKWHET